MLDKEFKFTAGSYSISIFAPSQGDADIAWEYLQERNYYPTGRRWYTENNSCNPPEKWYTDAIQKTAKEYLLENYLPTTNDEERELWYKTCEWAPIVVQIMVGYKKQDRL